MLLVSRTRATLRSAEFGFLGVTVYTRVQTPRFWGHFCRAGEDVLYFGALRPLRTNWLNVGTILATSPRCRLPRPQRRACVVHARPAHPQS